MQLRFGHNCKEIYRKPESGFKPLRSRQRITAVYVVCVTVVFRIKSSEPLLSKSVLGVSATCCPILLGGWPSFTETHPSWEVTRRVDTVCWWGAQFVRRTRIQSRKWFAIIMSMSAFFAKQESHFKYLDCLISIAERKQDNNIEE